jgi:hypothetical protein
MKIMHMAVIAGLLGACDEASDPAATEQTTPIQACTFDFTADVREGPSAPMQLAGKITLAEGADGLVRAQLDLADTTVQTTGTLVDDRLIHLHFSLPDGGAIHGVGPLPSALGDCTGELEGDLVGPAEGDTGDWLASSPTLEVTCITTGPICTIIPRSRSDCRNNYCSFDYYRMPGETVAQCTDRCDAGSDLEYAYYVCASGGGVSMFFPPTMTTCN